MCGSLELVRYAVLFRHGAFYTRDLTADGQHFIFIVNNTFSFDREINSLRRDDVWGYYKPFRFVAWFSGFGKSSCSISQNMYDHHSGHLLYTATTSFVYVDRQTRRPCELPKWFVERAEEYLNKINPIINHALEKKSIASIPVEVTLVFSYEIKALMSDCDKNGHVNQTAYVKWCSDVGVLAAGLGRYRNFKKDIGMYALKELSVQYIGETLVDETVLVQTWEDTNEEMTVHFVIKKKDKVIFYAKLKHFDEGLADVGPVTDISGAKL